MKFFIKVHPGSKIEKVVEKEDGSLDVKVKAPAKDGKANKALISALSKYLKIPKSLISIKAGHSTKNKIIEIED